LKVSFAGGGTEGGGADRRPVTGGRLDEAALSLGAEPVAVAPDGQHMTVVQEPVELQRRLWLELAEAETVVTKPIQTAG
jgi:hypothetical protein